MHALLDTCTFLWLAFEPDDPFDRLLAAHAIESGSILLSPDTPLSLLGAARLW